MPGIVSENPQYGEPEIRPISVSSRSGELPKPPHKSRLGQFFLVSAKVEHSVLCYDQKVGTRGGAGLCNEGELMDTVHRIKMWIGGLTEIGLMLLALAIVAALLIGGQLPFFGGVVANIIGMVAQLGSNGLVGLIVLGIIMWLFSHRSVA